MRNGIREGTEGEKGQDRKQDGRKSGQMEEERNGGKTCGESNRKEVGRGRKIEVERTDSQ